MLANLSTVEIQASGVGPIAAGDVVEVEIENIGVLRNPVLAE
jgi:2-keto-4-pentenoate hydratase/2-oxohepta-3-ene-1,7-dioic acid hydratase in catechol pathway